MPKKCCIPSCKIQEDDPGGLHLSFFQIPKDTSRREKWAASINNFFKSEIQFKKFAYVCELHFEETSFNKELMGVRLRLKKQAYPTIFHNVLSCDEQINFLNSNMNIVNDTLAEESFKAEGERSQNVASYDQKTTRKMDVSNDISNTLMKDEIGNNSHGFLAGIKTEEINNFEESKLEFEKLYPFDLCKIKTENCAENFSPTNSDLVLISRENIKTEYIDPDEDIQEINSNPEIKVETFELPIFKNDVDDFSEELRTEETTKIISRKKFNTEKSVISRKSKSKKYNNLKDLQYEICSKIFQCNPRLKKSIHNSVITNKSKNTFNCGSSTQKNNLIVSNLKEHTKTNTEQSFQCEICLKCYDKSYKLKRHSKIHSCENPFICEICSRCFTEQSNLKKHFVTHTGEKPFKCKICLKCFTQSNSLRRHIKTHTGEKSYRCDICSKYFTEQSNLKKHIRTHTGEKPFKCKTCSKCFARSNCLKRHMRTHTGENPFRCEICSKCFTMQSYLKKHIRIHTGEKPFECEICSKCFTQLNSLKTHIRTHTIENLF